MMSWGKKKAESRLPLNRAGAPALARDPAPEGARQPGRGLHLLAPGGGKCWSSDLESVILYKK
jgi:hypothetical protein